MQWTSALSAVRRSVALFSNDFGENLLTIIQWKDALVRNMSKLLVIEKGNVLEKRLCVV